MKVFVVGDVMLDTQLHTTLQGNYEGADLCLTGQRWDYFPGGAANVAALLRGMGHEVSLFGLTGGGGAARELENLLYGIDVHFKDILNVTTAKMRFYEGTRMFRVDCEDPRESSWAVEECLSVVLATPPDCIVFSDYGKGVFGLHVEEPIQQIIRSGIPTVVDPKGDGYSRIWDGATVATPNDREATVLDLQTEAIVTTKGGEGVVVSREYGNAATAMPVPDTDVVQIVGAGDAFVASIAAALAEGSLLMGAVETAIEYATRYVSLPRSLVYKEIEKHADWCAAN